MAFFLVPFERSDGFTGSLLKVTGCLFERNMAGADLIFYVLKDEDWGACGTIMLRREGAGGCECVYFRPPVVTVDEAVHFFSAFKRRQQKVYASRRLAENPVLSQDEVFTESLTLASVDLRVEYPDFPKVNQERLRAYLFGEVLDKEWNWDWFTPAIQSYLSRKRMGLFESITQKHGPGLVELQVFAPPAGNSRSGPRPTDPQVKEQIIAEWEKVCGWMNQEVFCSSKGIGTSTLRAWMRAQKREQKRAQKQEQEQKQERAQEQKQNGAIEGEE